MHEQDTTAASSFLNIIQAIATCFGIVISLFSLADWQSFKTLADQVYAISTGLIVTVFAVMLGSRPVRTRLVSALPQLIFRVGALFSVWLLILVVCLIGIEVYTRQAIGYVIWSTTAKLVHPNFSDLYRVYIWNREYYKANPSFFEGWPIDIETFEPDQPGKDPAYRLRPNERRMLKQGQLLPAGPGDPVYWSSNSWGFRGPEFSVQKQAGVIRIVCMGASTTAGMQGDTETYPHYLQEELSRRFPGQRIEIINAGFYGISVTDFSLIFRERVLPLQPDLIILYEGNNTLQFEEYVPDLTCGLWSCWLESYPSWFRWLYNHSATFLTIADKTGWTNKISPPMPHKFHDDGPTPSELKYREGIRQLVREVQAHHMTIVLSSFITIAHDGIQVSADQSLTAFNALHKWLYPLTPGEVKRIYDRINREAVKVAREFNAPFIDVAAGFPLEAEYFDYDHYHLSPQGNRILADRFADYLTQHILPAEIKQAATTSEWF